jgi:drug/metabolite transporter (DMT)-like permease
MNMQRKAYILAVFCICYQAALSLGVKYVFSYLGDTISLTDEMVIYSVSLSLMGFYAILWQFVLKSLDLSVANSMMSLAPVLTFLGGHFFFNEKLSMANIIGFSMISIGLLMIFNSKRLKGIYVH